MRLPPTPCRVCFRPCVFNKFSHFWQKMTPAPCILSIRAAFWCGMMISRGHTRLPYVPELPNSVRFVLPKLANACNPRSAALPSWRLRSRTHSPSKVGRLVPSFPHFLGGVDQRTTEPGQEGWLVGRVLYALCGT